MVRRGCARNDACCAPTIFGLLSICPRVVRPAESEAELEMFAEGFAWSTHGIAPDIVERLNEILPAALVERLPAARAAFRARCEPVWGSAAADASRTPVPDWIE
jgi:hypothetical protein